VKQCGRCKQWKEEEDFHWYEKKKGTRQPYCKECMAELGRAPIPEHPAYPTATGFIEMQNGAVANISG
jgi:hypothetical protein